MSSQTAADRKKRFDGISKLAHNLVAWKNAFAKSSNTPADLLVELKQSTNAIVKKLFCSTTTSQDVLLSIIYGAATFSNADGTTKCDNDDDPDDGSWIVTHSLV